MYDMKLVNSQEQYEYQRAQIHEIETNSNTKNIRNLCMGINDQVTSLQQIY
jgi:hypothetical protein